MSFERTTCAEAADNVALFVLGALEPEEAAAVRGHLETCPELHEEFAQLGGVVPYLNEMVDPAEPPPALRERILARLAAESTERESAGGGQDVAAAAAAAHPDGAAATPGEPAATPEEPAATPIPFRRAVPAAPESQGRIHGLGHAVQSWLMPLAAVLLIGVLAGWNVLLQQDASRAADRAAVLRDAIVAGTAPGATVARISGTGAAPGSGGFAAFTSDGTGYLVLTGLPSAPEGRTYQAWYVRGDEAASAGVLEVGDDGLAVLDGLERDPTADQVALTLEQAGGADQPTLPIVAAGDLAPLEGTTVSTLR